MRHCATVYSRSRVPVVERFVDDKHIRQRFVIGSRNRLFQMLKYPTFVQSVDDKPATWLHNSVGLSQHFQIVAPSVGQSEAVLQRDDDIKTARRKRALMISHFAVDEAGRLFGNLCEFSGSLNIVFRRVESRHRETQICKSLRMESVPAAKVEHLP